MPLSLRRRRHLVTLDGTPRAPEGAGADQPKRRAYVRWPIAVASSRKAWRYLVGQGVQGRVGISGVELCDDHHCDAAVA